MLLWKWQGCCDCCYCYAVMLLSPLLSMSRLYCCAMVLMLLSVLIVNETISATAVDNKNIAANLLKIVIAISFVIWFWLWNLSLSFFLPSSLNISSLRHIGKLLVLQLMVAGSGQRRGHGILRRHTRCRWPMRLLLLAVWRRGPVLSVRIVSWAQLKLISFGRLAHRLANNDYDNDEHGQKHQNTANGHGNHCAITHPRDSSISMDSQNVLPSSFLLSLSL